MRGDVALSLSELLPISASAQPCAKFGVHEELSEVTRLYEAGQAAFIANGLGLDPSLPLPELLAAANRKMGIKTPGPRGVTSAEMRKADKLIAAARAQRDEKALANAVDKTQLTVAPATCECRCCGKGPVQVCSRNGCCARCLFETDHFQRMGYNALSERDEAELSREHRRVLREGEKVYGATGNLLRSPGCQR